MNFSTIWTSWKTTLQSILTAVIGLSALAPTMSWLTPKQAAIAATAGAVAKVVLGAFQSDGIVVPSNSTVKQTTTIQTGE